MLMHMKAKQGFTLIEVLVALTLFTLTVLATVSALFVVNDSAKRTQVRRTLLDNLSFALEDMSRTIRVGTTYHCSPSVGGLLNAVPMPPQDCPFSSGGSTALAVVSPNNELIAYKLQSTSTGSVIQKCAVSMTSSPGAPCEWIDITAPGVTITGLAFYVTGSTPRDPLQPRVHVFISGRVQDKFGGSDFSIQTLLSQRAYDI